jgi:hypothetical protein
MGYSSRLIVGPAGFFALAESAGSNYVETISTFELSETGKKKMVRIGKQIQFKVGTASRISRNTYTYSLALGARGGRLLAGDEFGYKVFDSHTGDLTRHFIGDRYNIAIAISPDGRRVMSLDSDGLVLRDVSSNEALPRLATLPWGGWGSRVHSVRGKVLEDYDLVSINADWTQCLATSDPAEKSTSRSRARTMHSWKIDLPLASTE